MRKGIITGVAVSAVLHAGFVFGSNLFPKEVTLPGTRDEGVRIDPLIVPPMPPEPVDEVEKVKDLKDPPAVAPVPDIPDHPKAPIKDQLVQRIEPPKPPSDGVDSRKIPIDMPVNGPGELKNIFTPDQLQRNPEVLSQARPLYPYDGVRNNLTGSAKVSFIVTATGEVVGAHAVSSTDRMFEQPAVDAVTRWKFRAGIRDNHPVNTRMVVEINFTLDK